MIGKLLPTFRMLQLSAGWKKDSSETEVMTWSVKAGSTWWESQVPLLCVLQGHWRWEGQSTPRVWSRVSVRSGYTAIVLCWRHSGPVWRTELKRTLCQTQQIIKLRRKVDALRFGLPQLKAQLQLTRPQILSKQAIHKREEKRMAVDSMSRQSNILVKTFLRHFLWCCIYFQKNYYTVTSITSGICMQTMCNN